MVAYSFKARFVAPIQAGTKRGTIRALGRRPHAQPGQLVQLYTGMRTKACRKIAPDVVCESVVPVTFDLQHARPEPSPAWMSAQLWVDGQELDHRSASLFARRDGFDSFSDMVHFWLNEYGLILFEGVQISWLPPEVEMLRDFITTRDGASAR